MNKNNGIGGTTLLQILFIGLKLSNIIRWSWWWVLSPTWITLIIALIIIAIVLAII